MMYNSCVSCENPEDNADNLDCMRNVLLSQLAKHRTHFPFCLQSTILVKLYLTQPLQ